MFKIYKKSGNDFYDFTDICGKIKLRSTDSEISEELSFDIKGNFLNEADIIQLYENDKKVFEGIVVTLDISENETGIKAFDYGWYLNKNEDVYQFNSNISNCIDKICNDHEIPIGNIVEITVQFSKIIRGNLNDIIKKLMEYASKNNAIKYIWEMRGGKFYLEEENKNVVVYNTNIFGSDIDITKLISDSKIKKSIENLVNAVKVVDQEENSINVLDYKEDSNSIYKYGKLQKLEYLSKDEKENATNIAESQLKLLNKFEVSAQVTLPGIIECRANKVLEFNDDIIGLKGKFKIKQCTHNISSTSHLMSLELELIE